MFEGTSAPNRPLTGLPERVPGSVRRTMHVDVGPRVGWGAELPMSGAARDLRTHADGLGADVLAEATVEAAFDGERRLTELWADPPCAWTALLIGTRAGGGFRRRLDQLVPADQARSLLRQVVDDMPAAALISGYGFMRLARRRGLAPETMTPPGVLDRMVDLCSGWRAGGAAMSSVAAGTGVPMQDCPPAPPAWGEDRWAFHDCAPLATDAMRRRRCLDVAASSDGSVAIWAMFRDSVGEPDGGEAVLHEYAVRVGVEDGTVSAIEAEPRVLPFAECPAAAANVGVLVGTEVSDLAAAVPALLSGVSCCTHLNDLLRALGGLAGLVELVATEAAA